MKTTTRLLSAVAALTLTVLLVQQTPVSAAEAAGMHGQMPGMEQMQQMPGMMDHGQMMQQMPNMMGNGQMPGMMMGNGQMQGMGQGQAMQGMQGMQQPSGDDGPSSLAFAGANNKMHRGMAITYTGNADVDFVRGMIPHHQGAIDMAKIVLAFGADPEIKALAEGIVKAQEAEIAEMEAWLAKNGK